MRKLGRTKQISYPSHPDIIAKADLAAAKLALSLKFGGAKLRTGHVMNALALWAAELPDDELLEAVGPMLSRLESFLGRDSDPATGPLVDAVGPAEDSGDAGYNPVLGSSARKRTLPKSKTKRPKASE